jgi:L-lactate dehydrogenase
MLDSNQQITKVAIIGAGHVGASFAYALQLRGLASEIVLINAHHERAEGEAMDLNHGTLFARPVRVWAGDISDCVGADVIVLTAGAAQKPGETRLDLLKRNAAIFQSVIPQVVQYTKDAVLIVATNPVDVLTYATWKISGLPARQVIGSGTILDTARFRYLLSQHFDIEPRSIHAYIIGEHGDSQVPVWTLANIAGIRLDEYCRLNRKTLDTSEKGRIALNTRRAAYEIISRKGATYYAIAAGLVRIIEAIVRDENSVLTVSGLVMNKHGLNDVALSLPSVINRNGIANTLELPLSEGEKSGLEKSAHIIRDAIHTLGEFPMDTSTNTAINVDSNLLINREAIVV